MKRIICFLILIIICPKDIKACLDFGWSYVSFPTNRMELKLNINNEIEINAKAESFGTEIAINLIITNKGVNTNFFNQGQSVIISDISNRTNFPEKIKINYWKDPEKKEIKIIDFSFIGHKNLIFANKIIKIEDIISKSIDQENFEGEEIREDKFDINETNINKFLNLPIPLFPKKKVGILYEYRAFVSSHLFFIFGPEYAHSKKNNFIFKSGDFYSPLNNQRQKVIIKFFNR